MIGGDPVLGTHGMLVIDDAPLPPPTVVSLWRAIWTGRERQDHHAYRHVGRD